MKLASELVDSVKKVPPPPVQEDGTLSAEGQ